MITKEGNQVNKSQLALASFSCATFLIQHADGERNVIESLGITSSLLRCLRILSLLLIGITAVAASLIARKKEDIIHGIPAVLLNATIGITFLFDAVYIFLGKEYIQLIAVLLKLPVLILLILSRRDYRLNIEAQK